MDLNDRQGEPLQSGDRLGRAFVIAGALSLALLIGLLITSLLRAPAPASTWFVGAAAALVAIGLVVDGPRRWSQGR